jgi:hypothetical protein
MDAALFVDLLPSDLFDLVAKRLGCNASCCRSSAVFMNESTQAEASKTSTVCTDYYYSLRYHTTVPGSE